MDNFNQRTRILIKDEGIKKLQNSHVLLAGLGGVGGICAHMLARASVGQLTIIDFDKVDITNINRQIVAYHSTIGLHKTEVLKKQLLDINPDIKLKLITERLTEQNIEAILKDAKPHYVIDAIDDVPAKVALIKTANLLAEKTLLGLQIISSMGAGKRVKNPNFQVTDIYKTKNDPLAKIVRSKLRQAGVKKLKVVASEQPALEQETPKPVGSISYAPNLAGALLAAEVINDLLISP
ncbi:MAG: ThiF family adenylyltransferase [Firmicutes bacterium]|nr:ThiF family adenylyltransferase [Bacillota bacterium]